MVKRAKAYQGGLLTLLVLIMGFLATLNPRLEDFQSTRWMVLSPEYSTANDIWHALFGTSFALFALLLVFLLAKQSKVGRKVRMAAIVIVGASLLSLFIRLCDWFLISLQDSNFSLSNFFYAAIYYTTQYIIPVLVVAALLRIIYKDYEPRANPNKRLLWSGLLVFGALLIWHLCCALGIAGKSIQNSWAFHLCDWFSALFGGAVGTLLAPIGNIEYSYLFIVFPWICVLGIFYVSIALLKKKKTTHG